MCFAFVWGALPPDNPASHGLYTAATVLYGVVALNVMLAVFNMLPIPPLDGGNVLMGVLPPAAAVQFSRLRQYGFVILYALLLTGLFQRIVLPPANAIVSLLIRGAA